MSGHQWRRELFAKLPPLLLSDAPRPRDMYLPVWCLHERGAARDALAVTSPSAAAESERVHAGRFQLSGIHGRTVKPFRAVTGSYAGVNVGVA